MSPVAHSRSSRLFHRMYDPLVARAETLQWSSVPTCVIHPFNSRYFSAHALSSVHSFSFALLGYRKLRKHHHGVCKRSSSGCGHSFLGNHRHRQERIDACTQCLA